VIVHSRGDHLVQLLGVLAVLKKSLSSSRGAQEVPIDPLGGRGAQEVPIDPLGGRGAQEVPIEFPRCSKNPLPDRDESARPRRGDRERGLSGFGLRLGSAQKSSVIKIISDQNHQ
jgi:hypothetical protein